MDFIIDLEKLETGQISDRTFLFLNIEKH